MNKDSSPPRLQPNGSFECDIAVVGAGPAGLAAACSAAEAGKQVGLVDDTPWLGGQIWRGRQTVSAVPQGRHWIERFRRSGGTLLDRTSVVASPEPHVLQADHPEGPRAIRWAKLMLATSARELFLPFPGWTLPGVFCPGGLQALVKNGWPVNGQRVVIAGTGPLLLAVADGLKKHGATVVSVNDQAPWSRWPVLPRNSWRTRGNSSRVPGSDCGSASFPPGSALGRSGSKGPQQMLLITNE